jgi:hypothetical protein
MYNNGNSSKNVTGASVVDGTMESADYADNGLSGDKIDGGIISNFQSTGIDDRLPTGKVLTLSDNNAAIDGKADVVLEDAVTNASSDVLKLTHTTSGTTGTGMGAAMVFRTENSTYSNINDVARIYTRELSETELKNDLIFETKSNNVMTEKARILWSGGITFNGDTAAANALDDYEEGTWDAVVEDSSGNPATMRSSNTTMRYTKIGRQVTVQGSMGITDKGSMVSTSPLYFSGLPFTVGTDTDLSARTVGSCLPDFMTLAESPVVWTSEGLTKARFSRMNSGAGSASVLVSQVSTGFYANINLTYTV